MVFVFVKKRLLCPDILVPQENMRVGKMDAFGMGIIDQKCGGSRTRVR